MANSRLCSIPKCGKPVKSKSLCSRHYKRLWQYGDPLSGRTPVGEPLAFLETSSKTDEADKCILWPYSQDKRGYGQIRMNGRMTRAARIICQWATGSAPTINHHAAHGCGNASCVNPHHIRWATPKENNADKLTHGTIARGETQGKAKLTTADVFAIRERLSKGETLTAIAKEFGIAFSHVSRIKRGESWSWLKSEPHKSP